MSEEKKILPVSFASFMEMADKLSIERILNMRAEEDGDKELAEELERKVELVKAASSCDLAELHRGNKIPMITTRRLHDHGKVQKLEGFVDANELTMVMDCVDWNAIANYRYCRLQDRVQTLKQAIGEAKEADNREQLSVLDREFVKLQLQLDACNQARSNYKRRGDELMEKLREETRQK
jgi:hypothetical protein